MSWIQTTKLTWCIWILQRHSKGASQKINKEDASMWNTGKRTPMDHQVAKEQATKSEDQRERFKLDKRQKRSA